MQAHPAADDCYAHDTSVVAEELDDDVCLYLPASNDVAILNRTATDIWVLIDGATTTARLTAQLAAAYGTTADALARDVASVVDDLAERGFLRRADPG